MAIALAKVTDADCVIGNKRLKVRDATFSGNYATGGETVNASDVGLRRIDQCFSQGFAAGSTPTSGNPVGAIVASGGGSVVLRLYELGGTGAAGDPLAEKTNAEAYISGQNMRLTFIGV